MLFVTWRRCNFFVVDLDLRRCVDSLCVQITNVLSALIAWESVLDFGRIFGEKEKCSRKNSVAHILFELGEVEQIVSFEFLEYSQ